MNIVVTSKDEILKTNRELIQKQGWSAVSIRSVAAEYLWVPSTIILNLKKRS